MSTRRPQESKPELAQASAAASGARPMGFAATLLAGLEQLDDGVVLLEPEPQAATRARVAYTNAAFAKLVSSSLTLLAGQPLAALFPDACANEGFAARLEAGEAARAECARDAGGAQSRTLELSLSPVRDSAGSLQHWFGLVRDVTSERRLARESSERERLGAVALLAAGMAHEINNPLASVTTNLEWLAATLPSARPTPGGGAAPLSSVSAALIDALAGAERVETTIQHLALLSGIEYSQRELVDVRLLLDAALHELEPVFSGGVQIQRDYADAPPVFVSQRRLKQVFLNLLTNAAQAIAPDSEQRTVIVRTSVAKSVRIDIEDTGSGVPPELEGVLFHPFVTTKPMGVGKGLGLYLAKTILDAAGGSIGFTRASGGGTTFWVELPMAPTQLKVPASRLR